MSVQIAVRLPEALTAGIDELVASGAFESRAAAVRVAIERLLDAVERQRVGLAIADGYRRVPQTDDEVRSAESAAVESITEEPW